MQKIETKNINSILEGIKHIDDYGNEFQLARELIMALEYKSRFKISKKYYGCQIIQICLLFNRHYIEI